MTSSIHPTAECSALSIGKKTQVSALSVINKTAKIGQNCKIGTHVFVNKDVECEDNVIIESGTVIAANVYVETGCTIGANVSIMENLVIGSGSRIQSGSVVTKNVPKNSVVEGNPAQIVQYLNQSSDNDIDSLVLNSKIKKSISLGVRGVEAWPLPNFDDMRGSLTVSEFSKDLPFTPKRSFLIHSVPNNKIRGEHAHKLCDQFLIAANGSLNIVADDGSNRKEFCLHSPHIGIYLPAGIWARQYKFSSDSVLLVFASRNYDPDDYIRSYTEFLNFIKNED